MKKKCYRFLYNFLSLISTHWDNRWISKYKIACGMGLLVLSGGCQLAANKPGETEKDTSKETGSVPENMPGNEDFTCYEYIDIEPDTDAEDSPEEVPPPPPPPPVVTIEEIPMITCYEPAVMPDCYMPAYVDEPEEDESFIYTVVEEMPEFPGGQQMLMEYINKNIIYPEKAIENSIQGRVICTFVVDEKGDISNIEVLRGIDTELDEEAVRIINTMPGWTPGIQRGKAVKVQYTIPVTFKLPKEEEPEE